MLKLDTLRFDPEQAYAGDFEAEGISFKTYQTYYVTKPVSDEFTMRFFDLDTFRLTHEVPVSDVHKMNIKVPTRYKDRVFCEADMAKAPILFYIPWSADSGHPVSDPGSIYGPGHMEIIKAALQHGWVVVEPGMRGVNCHTGKNTGEDYENFGKIPYPLIDLKAAIRYLRYESNKDTIPGDKERIFAAGFSSAGCGSSVIGVSGNAALFEPYFEEIGAAPGRDDVFGAMPSCPVMSRNDGDPAVAWVRWGTLDENEGYDPLNVALTQAFVPYQEDVAVKAEFDVPEAGIVKGDLISAENYVPYMMVYVKACAVKFLNSLGSKAAIDAYLQEKKPALPPPYMTPETERGWIKPVYDKDNPDLVTDILGTWQELWHYILGDEQFDAHNQIFLQYDKAMTIPKEGLEENAAVNALVGPYTIGEYGSLSDYSFGKSTDFASVYTEFGQKLLHDKYGVTVSDEYQKIYQMQRHAIDPMYFLKHREEEGATVCKHWFMRSGSLDFVIPWPIFFNLALKLQNEGNHVDVGLVWDQGHSVTSELDEFFAFADQCE